MSITSSADESNFRGTTSSKFARSPVESDLKTTCLSEPDHITAEALRYIVTHVFLPVKLPNKRDDTLEKDIFLTRAVCAAAHAYSAHVSRTSENRWHRITRMLDNLQASALPWGKNGESIVSHMGEMQTGDSLVLFFRSYNPAIILTKWEHHALFEVTEVLPPWSTVRKTAGNLVRSYPEGAVVVPNEVLSDDDLQFRLVNFLQRWKDGDSCPSYIAALESWVLRGVGRPANIPLITKRIRDHADRDFIEGWRRSPVWLLIRVTLQMSFHCSLVECGSYKQFMLFIICTIANDANITALTGDHLHLMASKVLRRSKKLGSSIPDWLSQTALRTCARLREVLDARWVQLGARISPFQNPSQDELERDTQLSLPNSHKYVRDALQSRNTKPVTSFNPGHRHRGILDDFLSSDGAFFEEAYQADSEATLYDVEHLVEDGIDDWIACVANMDEACAQLAILMDRYITRCNTRGEHPEDKSIKFLMVVELFVALDKLVVKEIPMFADYSPEIRLDDLEKLLLRRTISLHRLSCAYQYLSARHSLSRPGWSVLSNTFIEESFPIRYYDQSPRHQQLKARIEADAIATDSRSPLPLEQLPAKVVVFELQCPACVRSWRSAVLQVLDIFDNLWLFGGSENEDHLLSHYSALQRYFSDGNGPSLRLQFQFAYYYQARSQSQGWLILRYAFLHGNNLRVWSPRKRNFPFQLIKWLPNYQCSSCAALREYIHGTSHTSNDILATQVACPTDLSLDEFITFGQLRSGGSLQWANILRGLRSRTLNFRRCHVHFLLTYAVGQVGPFDLESGTWVWHRDLHDACFCNNLLNELESLFVDVGMDSICAEMMNTMSLLLTRVLASSPSHGVSERAISLLRGARKKSLSWTQELAYNLSKAPMNRERGEHLLDMAAACRSTFDVDPTILHQPFLPAEDIGAAISSGLFVHALRTESSVLSTKDDAYRQLVLQRDLRLSFALENILRDMILTDASDYGVDLAVGQIFAYHRPYSCRWERLARPNTCWLVCQTKATMCRPSQTVHLNLLNGELRVDNQPLGGLPQVIRDDPECQLIFRDQGFFLLPSNVSGMDFTTPTTFGYKVHFSLRDDRLFVKAQSNQSEDVFELIPSRELEPDLPPALTNGHIHWLNLSTCIIEIRPIEGLWEQSPDNWRIDFTSRPYRAYKGREALVSVCSPTWAMVSRCFKCLDVLQYEPCDFLVTTSLIATTSMARLSATLPHYGLSFSTNDDGELESHEFKNMVYDENQSIGALYGLENILVFRHKNRLVDGLVPRCILIPNGFLEKHTDHLVRVSHPTHIQPLYHTYEVNTELGSLTGSDSLANMQFLAYLHAMTSCDRPDPLTSKTGAQAAVSLLQSAGCRSIMELRALYVTDRWTSTQFPYINILQKEISSRYYWNHDTSFRRDFGAPEEAASEARAMQRGAYLFPTLWEGLKNGNLITCGPLQAHETEQCTFPYAQTPWLMLNQLLSDRSAPDLPSRTILDHGTYKTFLDDPIPDFNPFFCRLSATKCNSLFQKEYIAHLHASAQRLRADSRTGHRLMEKNRIDALQKHYTLCRACYLSALDILKKSLGPTIDPLQQTLARFGLWAPITADILLQCLASISPINLSEQWKTCLVSFALLFLDFQLSRRLLRFALDGLEDELSKELENSGCDGWNPEDYPDWLLIQIQGNFLIRRAQAEMAMEMISPKSGRSTVMQVNMGDGKSSVIAPISAAVLADGKQLVRLVVPKTLIVQMFDLLVTRLGGLTNRPIYHLPFSRSSKYDSDTLRQIMSRCMVERGILLVQPEDIASLKLTSIEKQLRKDKLVTSPVSNLHPSIHKSITTFLCNSLPEGSVVGNLFRWLLRSEKHPSKRDTSHTEQPQVNEDSGHTRDTSLNPSKWLKLQKWVDTHARDILDECDEILHPRFQLIYTFGLEQHLDGYPDRWTISQQILRLVKKHIVPLSRHVPPSMGHQCNPPGSFPHVPIGRTSDVGVHLVLCIVEDVMTGWLPSFRFQDIKPELHDAIRGFISDEDVCQIPSTVMMVEEYAKHSEQSYMWSALLLLRGLLACKILSFALVEKRWRIDYGLVSQSQCFDSSKTCSMLVVPYRAKDVPAPDTHFSHPDVTIILTCLSYYYGGLSEKQLRISFEILMDEDDPTAEYACWVEDYNDGSLLEPLGTLGEINLKSSEQWDKVIFPLFSRNQATIDFYLSRVVFPCEAKEFPCKISASSWNLVENRERVTTGFSGTNDGRWLLPMSIAHRNLDHQQGTSARALAYLLRPENDCYMEIHRNGGRETTHELLNTIAKQQPEIRVLLDVGGQILDLSNRQVAEAWLRITRSVAGAVYADENDELMVLARNGTTMPIQSSPLSQQLDRCIVYLDHAHTRGTDIKLPIGSRAAVTLGLKVSKDRLVQGCMRMRKLGRGHSVAFFAPPEVDLSIRTLSGKRNTSARVTVIDILCWAINETWIDVHDRAPHWAQQGIDHELKYDAWKRFRDQELTAEELSGAWIQSERRSLQDLYAPSEVNKFSSGASLAMSPGIQQRCKYLGILSLPNIGIDEEHEREVSREYERERQVKLPPKAEPAEHHLHPDILAFVKNGVFPQSHPSNTFRPIFTTLERSSVATREAGLWSPFIFATSDFCDTIKRESTQGSIDQYLRPVQWILSSKRDSGLVLLSPFEADQLLPEIRGSEHVHLHLYAPRMSYRMRPSDDLRLYSIPPLPLDWTPPWDLIDHLNVFAGQVYLRDYSAYIRLCRFLDISADETQNDTPAEVRRKAFKIPGSFKVDEIRISQPVLPSVMGLLAIRNRGRPFQHTHMGKVHRGQPLGEDDFKVQKQGEYRVGA